MGFEFPTQSLSLVDSATLAPSCPEKQPEKPEFWTTIGLPFCTTQNEIANDRKKCTMWELEYGRPPDSTGAALSREV
jgi:hypothetical protein